MEKSRTHYSILNITTGVGGYFVNTLVGFVCRMVFVRCLTADYLGINGLFSNVLSMLSLAELGVGSAIGYALYKPLATHDEEKIASLMKFYGTAYKIIGISIGIIGVALLPFMRYIIGDAPSIKENINVIYLIFLFNTASSYFFSYRGALLQTDQKSYIVTGLNYIQTIAQSIIQIIYLLLTHEYYGYLIIQAIGMILYNFSISYVAKKQYPYIVGKEIKPLSQIERNKISKDVGNLMITRLAGILVGDTDYIIITFFNGLSVTGLTSNYSLFTGTLTTLLNQVFYGMNASIGNHNALSDKESQEKMFLNINFMNFWLFGWATVEIVCIASCFVELFFGEKYVMEPSIPMVLALNFYMVGMQNAVWIYKNTLGIFKQGRFVLVGTAILNIIFSLLLGKIWGVLGILFASAVARLFTNTWYDPYCVYKYGFGKNFKEYIKRYVLYGVVVIGSAGGGTEICKLIALPLLGDIICRAFISSLIFNLVVIIVFGKTKEFKYILNKGKEIFRRLKYRRGM